MAAVPAFALPLLLLAGFRAIVDELHADLARQGHPDVRPSHGYTLQAVGLAGATTAEVGRRLGVSKQAAGKTVDRLVALGYLSVRADPADARRKVLELTDRGRDLLDRSAEGFARIRARWVAELGADAVETLERSLVTMTGPTGLRLDLAGWVGL